MNGELHVYPDVDGLSCAAAETLCKLSQEAIESRGRFTLVLAGGNTPRRLYELLADDYRERIAWSKVQLFWGDERFVPADHPHNNYALALDNLLSNLPLPPSNVHRIVTETPSAAHSARAYERTLAAFFAPVTPGQFPVFDAILLGLGPDGHTASLFPGDPVLDETTRWVRATEAPAPMVVRERVTLTLPLINRARCALFLISGETKRDVLAHVLSGTRQARERYPAARVRAQGGTLWFLDRAARGDLKTNRITP